MGSFSCHVSLPEGEWLRRSWPKQPYQHPQRNWLLNPPKRGRKRGYAVPADAIEKKKTRTVKPRSKCKRCKQSTWA